MTIFRVTMTAVALASFMTVTLPAAAQDVRRPAKTAAHSTHAKKRTPVGQATAPRRASAGEQWMEHGSASGGGGGGGGGY
jgi:hypothetical protein